MQNAPAPIKKIVEYDLSTKGFEGHMVKVWINVPVSVLEKLGDNEDESRELLLKIYPEWNFVDFDGNPLPHTVEGLKEMGTDLMVALAVSARSIITEVTMAGFRKAS